MAHHKLKVNPGNIIGLWFGVDTPLRDYKIKSNTEMWAACQRVHRVFKAPSGALSIEQYRKSDLVAFARAVQQEMAKSVMALKLSGEYVHKPIIDQASSLA